MIVFGTLACMLMVDGLMLQPLINHDANLVYAAGPNQPRHIPERGLFPRPTQPTPVPEPSTLILLGIGAAGIGIYLYSKHGKDKNKN